MPFDFDTVKASERREESSSRQKGSKFHKLPDIGGPVTREVLKNFTCPACREVLEEAVAINGKLGWCGVKHEYVGGK